MEILSLDTKILVYTFEEGNENTKKLLNKAKLAATNAYAPYSGFGVGAAVLLSDGEIVTGNNQENAAYPAGLCAERVALFAANSQKPCMPVAAIAIAAFHNGDYTDEPCCPCGSCRQAMVEVENRFGRPMRIIMYGKSKIYEAESAKTLLPLSFGKESLSE
jgi:cytidine deaminase